MPAFVDERALTRKVFRKPASRRLQEPCGDIGAIIDHPMTAGAITIPKAIFVNPNISPQPKKTNAPLTVKHGWLTVVTEMLTELAILLNLLTTY